MALWTWWPGDGLPALRPIEGFSAGTSAGTAEWTQLTGLGADEVAARLDAGSRRYVARPGHAPVAYGWVARAGASIGEVGVAFRLRAPDGYLWDFATLPARRGRSVYPHVLQSILRAEGVAECRFRIVNPPEYVASARDIGKAGFRVVGDPA